MIVGKPDGVVLLDVKRFFEWVKDGCVGGIEITEIAGINRLAGDDAGWDWG